jgi:glycosyltransferase involved in cell wall biosynthesis
MNKSLVSVIIPAYNSEADIERNIISIKSQSYKIIEIIIVDDNSEDRTFVISKKYTDKAYKRPHLERSVQRNFGASKAKGDFLMFLDSDMKLSEDVVKDCVDLISDDPKVGAIAIPEVSVARSFWEHVKAFERSFYNKEGDEYTDAARFITREAFTKVGGYDETITGPEDWDLPDRIKKAGYKIARIKSIIYHYENVPNPFKLAKKKFYYGLKAYRYFENNKINPLGPKTIYFLRPVFYKHWKKLITHPLLTLSMFIMLTLEQLGGGFGFLIGKIRKY